VVALAQTLAPVPQEVQVVLTKKYPAIQTEDPAEVQVDPPVAQATQVEDDK